MRASDRSAMATTTIKKYGNRRLYDTEESRYITQGELADRIKEGTDVRIVDAKTNEDLTQATLVQIVLETKAARLLPVPLLAKLIRMQDDALGEFFSRYVSAALDLYLAARQGANAVSPYVPFATLPFSATNALARALGSLPFWGEPPQAYPPGYPQQGYAPPPSPPPPEPQMAASSAPRDDVASIRAELEELKRELRDNKKRR
ncbi:MAG TPA: polyhydroxyalkanoate synthesis regulator DNA-binding domain-containing protein [Polyangiaceae bacterium]|jgi:polyhydroxyalkanoate synthesis repressor PhaR|nr:polyhydroxyalkanoate synthesis regulator DNA-binding domain-containing protein [Polyangiaceae bacterium]